MLFYFIIKINFINLFYFVFLFNFDFIVWKSLIYV